MLHRYIKGGKWTLEIKLFWYAKLIIKRRTNMTSTETGKKIEMKVNSARMMFRLGEFFAGWDRRVLGLGCWNYAWVNLLKPQTTGSKRSSSFPRQQLPQHSYPPSAAWGESISLKILTQTQIKIKCSKFAVFISHTLPRLGCLKNYKRDDST